jgi:pyruvate dehydrogenase E1 component alpha subunit
VRSYLHKQQWADAQFLDGVEADAEALAVRLRDGVRALPDPDPLSMFDNTYAEPHTLVAEERAEYERYLAGFTAEGES